MLALREGDLDDLLGALLLPLPLPLLDEEEPEE